MFELLKDLWAYLSRPYLARIPAKIDQPYLLLARLVLICIVAGVTAGIISSALVSYHLIPDPGPSLLENNEMSKLAFAGAAVLIAPVSEELIFRAQLRRIGGHLFFISLIIATILVILTGTNWAYLITPFILLPLHFAYRFNLCGSLTTKYTFWARIFPWHFHLTAICFALVHLTNFEKGISLLPFGLLYTLPQLSIGLVLGYARVNYGLKYSIAIHSLYNLTFVLLFLYKQ